MNNAIMTPNAVTMDQDKALRRQLIHLINSGNAFKPFDEVVKDIPYDMTGLFPDDLPYTIWQQVRHLELAQWDILDFSRNPGYKELNWPGDYWPEEKGPSDEGQWIETLQKIKKDRQVMIDMVKDSENDLYEPFAHGDGQNLLREALLLAEHNAYHTGQILIMRRLLGIY